MEENIIEWLNIIQCKDVPESIKSSLDVDISSLSKRQILEKIRVIAGNDNTKQLYHYLMGFHIPVLDPDTENIIREELTQIASTLQNDIHKIPYIYILQKISEKHSLNIPTSIKYPAEKTKHFDNILNSHQVM